MQLKNEIVFNETFAKSFAKLLKQPFSATISLQLIATLKALNEQQNNVFAVRDSLLDRLAKKDSEGKIVRNDTGIEFLDDPSSIEFFNEMDGLVKLEFEVPLKEKLKLDDKIQISAEEILALQPVIEMNI
jgi:hypothetical protein